MNVKKILPIIFFIFGIVSCATPHRITSDYERGVNFSKYSTYQLLKHKDGFPYGMNPINQQRIERAIQREMLALGYKVKPNPDLIVAYFVKEKLVKEVDHYYRGYYRGWGFPIWVDVNHYKEGTLIIDLIDRENKQVIWHGAATERVYDDMRNVEERINETIQALFEQYYEDTEQAMSVAMVK